MVQSVGPSLQPVMFVPVQPIAPVSPALADQVAQKLAQPPQPPVPAPQVQALNAAVAQAAGRQDGLAPLMADLIQALDVPDTPVSIRAAATQLLNLQTPLNPGIAAPALRQAVAQSGLFLEARLAATPQTPPGPDLKAALLVLRQVLATAPAAAQAPAPATALQGREIPPPPYPGAPTRAQKATRPTLALGAPSGTVTARLLQQTDSALAREELLQAASMPEGPQRTGSQGPAERSEPSRWLLDIPFATPQGPAVAQMEISRDGRAPGAPPTEAPVWRVRFSLDAEPLGPVHAAVVLHGDQAHVGLWAERPDSAVDLRARTTELSAALAETADVVEVAVHSGSPPHRPPAAGRLVDQSS